MAEESFANKGLAADIREALEACPSALAAWNNLTDIAKRDFTSWIETAKQDETRRRRIRIACENLSAGKRRPCCFAVVPMDLYKALGSNAEAKAAWGALTGTERRDFTDWIENSEDKIERKGRILETCAMVAAGKRSP